MKNNYQILKQLIDLYEDYESEGQPLNLLDFTQWIINRLNEEPELNTETIKKTFPRYQSDQFSLIKKFNQNARFLETIARIARYQEFYTRKALKDLTINTRLEYLFLQAVKMMTKAKKTDLINIYLIEYTTGIDTIRRLINNGLIYEVQDKKDKRVKLLALTKKGEEELKQSKKIIHEENRMFLTAISDNKWKKALPLLEEIDQFHNTIYQEHNDKSFAEIFNLMGSLKHLYK